MDVIRVTKAEYEKQVPDRRVFFNEPAFCDLNKGKVEEVHYLVIMSENSPRFGLIAGIKDGVMKCPFSAPYSYPVEIRAGAKMEAVDEALDALESYCREIGVREIRFVFPPLFYDEHLLSGWINAFYRKKYDIVNMDLNYSVDLSFLNPEELIAGLPSKGRKHLRKAMKSGFEIIRCTTEEEFRESYDIVKANHDAKGRPTWLSFEQLMDTMQLVKHEAFIVRQNGKGICTQVFYETNKETVQCIYSGILPEYTNSGGMNLLSYHTVCYFREQGYKRLDRATATEDSVPNYGLCDFKESVGCKRGLKYSFAKNLS